MKIIGRTDDYGYILEATQDEIANLQGLDSHYSDGFISPKTGTAIEVEIIQRKAGALRTARRNMGHVSKNLMDLAEDLKPLDTILKTIE